MGEQRPLQYPLNRSAISSEDTPLDSFYVAGQISLPDWPVTDPDEIIPIIRFISANEFVDIASSVDVGRDLAYPENQITIWQVWTRPIVTDICTFVLSCLEEALTAEDPSELQENIRNLISSSDAGSNAVRPLTPEERSEDLFSGIANDGGSCNENILCGMATTLAQQIDIITRDWLEVVSLAASKAEKLSEQVGGLPIKQASAAAKVVEFAGDIGTTFLPNYETAYTTGYEDGLIEDFYCQARNNDCQLSLNDVAQIYGNRGIDISFGDLTQYIQWVVQRQPTGAQWVELAQAFTVIAMQLQNKIGILGNFRELKTILALGADSPSSVCQTFECNPPDDCGLFNGSSLFDYFEPGWEDPAAIGAKWDAPTQSWQCDPNLPQGNSNRFMFLWSDTPLPPNVTSIILRCRNANSNVVYLDTNRDAPASWSDVRSFNNGELVLDLTTINPSISGIAWGLGIGKGTAGTMTNEFYEMEFVCSD